MGNEADRRREASDEILLAALAAGRSYAAAGELAGVSARTVRRRMADAAFAAEEDSRCNERVLEITGGVLGMCDEALEVVRQCLRAERPADRLRAAQLTLSMALRFRGELDLERNLAAIEHTDPDTRQE